MTELTHRFSFDPKAKQILVHTGKVEIGQHVHSAFKKIVAHILGIDLTHIRVSSVSTEFSPDDGMTVGSLSMQVTGALLRSDTISLGASLSCEASQQLNIDLDKITLGPDTLEFSGNGKRCSIFDLPTAKRNVVTTTDDEHRLNANSTVAASISGQRQYIQDLVLTDMIYARALRGRQIPQEITDEFSSEATNNVWIVKNGGFSALVANTEVALDRAWEQFKTELIARDASCDGPVANWLQRQRAETQESGETSSINRSIFQTATRAFLLHASIAPSCAIARFKQGVLEIWTHSQGVFPLRDTVARHLGMQQDDVIVRHVPSAGSYGHNAADDAAMDAVLVSLQNEGKPVRVVWTRQDDFQYAPVGAAMHVQVEAQHSEDNAIEHWRQTIWSCPHAQRPGSGGNVNLLAAIEQDSLNKSATVKDLPFAIGSGAARNATPPYSIKSFGVTTHLVQDLPVRTSSIRGLGAQMNVVCIEAAMDKLAKSCATDPLDFRLKQLDDPRARDVLIKLRAVLESVSLPLQDNEAIGIAYSRYKEKAAYAAAAARVRLTDKVELADVWAVIDAGNIVDRSGALNQIEGGIVQAASWTLCEGVMLRGGYVDAAGWDDYPILGWSDIPEIHTTLVGEQNDLPYLGVGECMVGPASAAIVNGVSSVAGYSMSDLPLTHDKFLQAATNE